MKSVQKFMRLSSLKTSSRCWVAINQAPKRPNMRHFSSQQRSINFNSNNEAFLVSNDMVLAEANREEISSTEEIESFQPTVFSSEEIYTASPVNKA